MRSQDSSALWLSSSRWQSTSHYSGDVRTTCCCSPASCRVVATAGRWSAWSCTWPTAAASASSTADSVIACPGPGWLAGALFALAENLVLWPVILVLDRVHPEIRAGRLERFNQPLPFLQEVWRHVAYGVTLGLLVDRWQRHESEPAR